MITQHNNGKNFLPHLTDPLRLKIATRFAQHELRKLFPQFRDAVLLRSMDEQVERWYEELSLKNFWNGIHGISMGFRLKSLVPWITSLNIKWEEKDMPIRELWFGGKFGPIGSLGCPEKAEDVAEKLFLSEHKEILENTKIKLLKEVSKSAPRDEFPIFAVRKENELRVIDGNRRLLQAIVEKKGSIKAFVGELVKEPVFYEHWVPTSLLADLVFWHERQIEDGRDVTDAVARTVAELIRNSSAGRSEFTNRAVHRDNETHMRLSDAVNKILNI